MIFLLNNNSNYKLFGFFFCKKILKENFNFN